MTNSQKAAIEEAAKFYIELKTYKGVMSASKEEREAVEFPFEAFVDGVKEAIEHPERYSLTTRKRLGDGFDYNVQHPIHDIVYVSKQRAGERSKDFDEVLRQALRIANIVYNDRSIRSVPIELK